MRYSTIVQRDVTGFNQIYEAARDFEELNVMEAIVACKFTLKKVEQTLCLVRMYQNRLNIESMDLVEFSETFIEEYATDHNECFRLTEKLIRRIGTTITGSMQLFRKFCPVIRRRMNSAGRVVPTLDYTRLRFRHYDRMLFGPEFNDESVKTLLHEIAAFFYHLVTTLKLCKDMIRQEKEVMGDFERLKRIFEKSCDEVLHCVHDVFDTFGQVKLISEEELAERRKNARPMKEWLAREYHAHDKKWLRGEAYMYRLASGRQYGLDEEASILWANNPEWGRKVCSLIPRLDTLGIPFRNSKKAERMGKKGTFDVREMLYFVKWSGVSRLSDDGQTVIDEANERRFYTYLQKKYQGDYLLPTWQAVCNERKYFYDAKVSMQELVNNFASHLPIKPDAA